MRKILLVALMLMAKPVFANDWTVVVPNLKASSVEITAEGEGDEGGSCTGFVIDSVRKFVLTAAHCDAKVLYADNLKAEVKSKDSKADLMVLYVKDLEDRPALKLAKHNPLVGEEVGSFGWGYAMEQPLFRVAHVSAKDVALERAHYIAIDASFVPGQSGGAVVNSAGEVVLIVQLGNDICGFGVGAEGIDDKVGRFFAK